MSHPHPELAPPPPLADGALRVLPLGGLGEVGRNMAVLEHRGKLLIIDCGVLFPEENQPGVDLILPDFGPIADRLADVVGIVLTHGHEDHIGAVPYLLRLKPDIPLVGSQLTLALIEAKLKEHRITPYTLSVREGQVEQLGPFGCEFIAVNHSIPDALAVAVRTGSRSRTSRTASLRPASRRSWSPREVSRRASAASRSTCTSASARPGAAAARSISRAPSSSMRATSTPASTLIVASWSQVP